MNLLIGFIMLGSVTYYNPGVMEQVYQNRLKWGQVQPCPRCIGMVALVDRHVGELVWLKRPGFEFEGPFLVVDCAAKADYDRLKARGLVAEVDWETARRWGMKAPLRAVLVLSDNLHLHYGGIDEDRVLTTRPPVEREDSWEQQSDNWRLWLSCNVRRSNARVVGC